MRMCGINNACGFGLSLDHKSPSLLCLSVFLLGSLGILPVTGQVAEAQVHDNASAYEGPLEAGTDRSTQTGATSSSSPLRTFADERGFYVGAATSYPEFTSKASGTGQSVAQVLSKDFNIMAPEVETEFGVLEPNPPKFVHGQLVPNANPYKDFDFSEAEAMIQAAVKNHQAFRGFSLLSYHDQPGWLTVCAPGQQLPNCKVPWTPEELQQIMKYHIQTVMTYFKTKYPGVIVSWVVVNEPEYDNTNPNGTNHRLTAFDNVADSTGKPGGYLNYYKLAFQYAHEADPDVLLGLNDDHNDDLDGRRVQGLFAVVKELQAAGTPVSFVGFESHKELPSWEGTYSLSPQELIMQTMQRYADLGIKVMVTEADYALPLVNEADMSSSLTKPPTSSNPSLWADQATAFSDFFGACVLSPNCMGFLTWGVNPKFSYLTPTGHGMSEYGLPFGFSSDALPFDENNNPKPAYTAMQAVLQNAQNLTQIVFAKNMTPTSSNSGSVVTSSSSRYDGDYMIVSDGGVSTTVQVASDALYGLHIRAAGILAGGVAPVVEMTIDGHSAVTFTIRSALINDYFSSQTLLTAGNHNVGFLCTNCGGSAKREAFLDRFWMQPSQSFSHYMTGASFTGTSGSAVADSTSAAGASMSSGSSIETSMTAPIEGNYQLTLSTYTIGSGSTAPYAQVQVDGSIVGKFKITNQATPIEYPVALGLTAGTHTISILSPNTNPQSITLVIHHVMVVYQPSQTISIRALAMNAVPGLPLQASGEPSDVLDSPNGSLETVVTIPSPGTYNITLETASSDITLAGSGAQRAQGTIYVDGQSIGSFTASSDTWTPTIPLRTQLTSGSHTIKITVANQGTNLPSSFLNERNLAVQNMTLTPE